MLDEPYRWIEAVRNRREYLEEQLSTGSPVIALPYRDGIVMATGGSGASKLFEVYDQIALGGLGHPADLEKLRTAVLDIAHVEGFNRSPSDVNLQRLIKFGIAPVMKQAFEEVLHAPYIARLLFVELVYSTGQPLFLRLNYDGMFDENRKFGVLASSAKQGALMENFLKKKGSFASLPLASSLQVALRAWSISLLSPESSEESDSSDENRLDAALLENRGHLEPEVSLLDRTLSGTSKYRSLSREEIASLTQDWLP